MRRRERCDGEEWDWIVQGCVVMDVKLYNCRVVFLNDGVIAKSLIIYDYNRSFILVVCISV